MDFESTLSRAEQAGVQRIILTGMSTAKIAFNIDLVKLAAFTLQSARCYLTAGVHPYHANELATEPERSQRIERLSRSIQHDQSREEQSIVAFGEIGLDFDRTEHASKEVQIAAFKTQLDLLVDKGWDLPLFLHCRAAFDTFVDILSPYISRAPPQRPGAQFCWYQNANAAATGSWPGYQYQRLQLQGHGKSRNGSCSAVGPSTSGD